MNIINQSDLPYTCRTCLEKSGKLYHLERPILNVDVFPSTMITYCTSIEIVLDDDLPKGICIPCFKTIRIAYNFIKQFKEVNERLMAQRELNKNSYSEDVPEEEVNIKVESEFKEEIREAEQSNESLMNDLLDSSSDRDCVTPEEEIIIACVDENTSDCELTPTEIMSQSNEEETSEDDKTTENKDEPSNQNIFLTRHACPICFEIFPDFKRGFLRHLRAHHHKNGFKCNKCSLKTELSIELYIQHYTKTHLYQCPVCDRRLGSKSSFYYHSKGHINGNCFHCPHQDCTKSFQNQVSLKKHLQIHSDDAKYICSKCGKKFNTYDTFRYHNKTHDGNRSHLCNVCGRAFLQAVHLKYHMWHHTGIKQFVCGDCGKSYTSVTQLKKHRRKYCGSIETSDKSSA